MKHIDITFIKRPIKEYQATLTFMVWLPFHPLRSGALHRPHHLLPFTFFGRQAVTPTEWSAAAAAFMSMESPFKALPFMAAPWNPLRRSENCDGVYHAPQNFQTTTHNSQWPIPSPRCASDRQGQRYYGSFMCARNCMGFTPGCSLILSVDRRHRELSVIYVHIHSLTHARTHTPFRRRSLHGENQRLDAELDERPMGKESEIMDWRLSVLQIARRRRRSLRKAPPPRHEVFASESTRRVG